MNSLSIRPAVLADQWDKSATAVIFFLAPSFGLYHSNQSLTLTRIADRNNQSPAHFQLCDQWLRNSWTTGSDQDSIVRRICCPTECAVKTLYGGVVDLELPDP